MLDSLSLLSPLFSSISTLQIPPLPLPPVPAHPSLPHAPTLVLLCFSSRDNSIHHAVLWRWCYLPPAMPQTGPRCRMIGQYSHRQHGSPWSTTRLICTGNLTTDTPTSALAGFRGVTPLGPHSLIGISVLAGDSLDTTDPIVLSSLRSCHRASRPHLRPLCKSILTPISLFWCYQLPAASADLFAACARIRHLASLAEAAPA